MRQPDEAWLPVTGAEGRYEVSDLGRVRSVTVVMRDRLGRRRIITGRVLKHVIQSNGYPSVNIAGVNRRVHVLVMEAFVGPRPAGMLVRHRNGVKADVTLSNLLYGTPLENNADSIAHGVVPVGEGHWSAKVNDEAVAVLRALNGVVAADEIAKVFGISGSTARGIQKRLKWRHVTAEVDRDTALTILGRRRALVAFRGSLPIAAAALEMMRG